MSDTTASERKTLVDTLAANRAEILELLDGVTEELLAVGESSLEPGRVRLAPYSAVAVLRR